MNSIAEQHLAKAKDYVARGEEFYRKAAEEIVAAQEADPTLGYREIGAWWGKSYEWVRQIVQWSTTVKGTGTLPFSEPKGEVAKRHARSVLRDADPEEIAELLSEPDVRAKVSKAQDIAHADVERRSHEAERKVLGPEADDELREQQKLHDAEAEIFKARRAVIETLRLLDSFDGEVPDSWREEFLRTLDDIGTKLDLGRSLLVGDVDRGLAELLKEEV